MIHHTTRRTFCAFGLVAAAGAAFATPAPHGGPILTVSGRIALPDGGTSAAFDRAALEGLGTEGFVTSTPWYSRPVYFEGVRMDRLMRAVGAGGDTVTVVALNDYTTDLPIPDFERYGTLLALKRDGAYMPVRDKGPLFVVYPYDSRPELKSHMYYSRSAWQVSDLVVK